MTGIVPTATSLKDIYSPDVMTAQQQRWEKLLSAFEQKYHKPADFISRSPGRVNIIGEHIDYSLYEVLPMAVTADILLCVSVNNSSKINISNVNATKFPDRSFDIPTDGDVPIDASSLEWANYFKSGLRGATELLRKKSRSPKTFKSVGMNILVNGTVPSGGGISSSAAFVCASALAVLKANGEDKVDKKELVELAIVSERAVGVNSGGMDQAASVFPLRGNALYVSFQPTLNARPIAFPTTNPEMTFVISQTFIAADKHTTAPVCYNLRVVECSLAAVFLGKKLNLKKDLPKDSGPLGVSLRGLHNTYFEQIQGISDNDTTPLPEFKIQLETLVDLTKSTLTKPEGYTREEIASTLEISPDQLSKRYTSTFPVRADRFMLRQRALHVFTEALRVLDFMELLESPPSNSETLLQGLGDIMNSTQKSCREIYECSCPELDELCDLARGAGAYGSRLTGAGWGGCCVHLVPQNKVESVKQVWEKEYYRKRFPDISDEKLKEAVVVSKPGSGSCLFNVTGTKVV